ncbi:hypothetical protein KPL74_01680 [Bacillus sp. NP157]|nr:hypothetical protein KPL74_01680 [Bacillus sp. NP157]
MIVMVLPSLKRVLTISGAVAIALFLTFVPWESIRHADFGDLQNYYAHAEAAKSYLDGKDLDTATSFVTNEVIWHLLTESWIQYYGIQPEYAFLAISALTLVCFFVFTASRLGIRWSVLLINPLVIDLAFSQLRMALAISLLFIAYSVRKRVTKAAVGILTPLIHTASLLFVMFGVGAALISRWLERGRISRRKAFLLPASLGVATALVLGPLRTILLTLVHDRRAEYADMGSSVLYSSYWAVLLIALYFQPARYFKSAENCFAIIILALVSANMVVGGYSTRFLAASFPLLLVSMANMRGPVRYIMLFAFIVYATVQWIVWI